MIIKPEDLVMQPGFLLLREIEIESEGFSSGHTLEDKPFFAEVINGGNAGDILMFGRHSTTRIELNGKVYFLLNEEDILATVETVNKKTN